MISALAAKPVGDTFVHPGKISVRCSWDLGDNIPAVITGIIGMLTAFGLEYIAAILTGFAAKLIAMVGLGPAALIGIAILIAEIYLIIDGVPKIIASIIRNDIHGFLYPEDPEQTSLKDNLDNERILTYAGEGIAEAIARMAIEKAVEEGVIPEDQGLDPEKPGYDRFRKHFWQIIYVTDNFFKILVRKEET